MLIEMVNTSACHGWRLAKSNKGGISLALATRPGANRRELIRRFGISAPTGYKWIRRFERGGAEALADRSRRPRRQPSKSPQRLEEKVVELRRRHDCWGARKLRRLLERSGERDLPSATTVHNILRRRGLVGPDAPEGARPWRSFERESPNELWQMDFKGHFAIAGSRRCHPLTVCDDHSRFNLALSACADERTETVQRRLLSCFGRYGLPLKILCDNGAPWGRHDGLASSLELWLLRVGVELVHGRPYHPQTQGKLERFHRTLKRELLSRTSAWRDLQHCGEQFARFRELYNHERPHRALDLDCPADRYRASERPLPERIPDCESFYEGAVAARKVKSKGEIMFKGRTFFMGRAFAGETVAIEPFDENRWEVFYCWKSLGLIDLSKANKPKHNYNRLAALPWSQGSREDQPNGQCVNHVP